MEEKQDFLGTAPLGKLMRKFAVPCTISLLVGALGEVLDYRWCVTACGAAAMAACWLFIWRGRNDVRRIYETKEADA